MRQLYAIGIGVAVMLLLLAGLSKLGGGKGGDEAPASIEIPAHNLSEKATTTPQNTMNTTAATTSSPEKETQTIVMKTTMGDITIELYTKAMPITAGNFLKLVGSGYYDGIKFHRVIDGFMIQGGDPLTKDEAQQSRWGQGGPGYTIPDEFGPRYSNARGTISMANAGPNTGGSQFFINTVDNVFLDGKHPVFGHVVSGMEVVDAISKVKTGGQDRPLTPISIINVATAK